MKNLNPKRESEVGLQQEIVTSVACRGIETPVESGLSCPTRLREGEREDRREERERGEREGDRGREKEGEREFLFFPL